MKKILALILAMTMCLSLCACGSRDVVSPGAADDETTENAENNAEGDTANPGTASDSEDAVSGNNDADGGNDDNSDNDSDDSDSDNDNAESGSNTGIANVTAPDSTEEFKYDSGNADIDISYGDGMDVTETEDGLASVAYGDSRLFVEDVTSEYDPSKDDAASFLYDYAYAKCVEMVFDTYGEITQFNGEYPLSISGNEIYAYGAQMTCAPQIPVYAFIKLVTLDDGEGYAVVIGICNESDAGIFDNVEVQ